MGTTRIFKKLPNLGGVHFGGFEDIVLESREKIKEDIDNILKYCKFNTKSFSASLILGDWGEGKTETYYRIIEPYAKDNGDYSFFISASTLLNCFKDEKVIKVLKTTNLISLKLLTVIFNTIKEESKEKELIPLITEYESAENYIESILKILIGNTPDKRIYIFLDEFEELLLKEDILSQVVSGIKELINGTYSKINENGKFEGTVQLFISCTPYAFYKIQTLEKTSITIGGFTRRLKIINLSDISRKESIEFLYGLLKYSYDNNFPEKFPISNFGVFNVIFKISQGNLGTLVSLFTKIFSKLRLRDDLIKLLDYDTLLDSLKDECIYVYDANTNCLEINSYNKIIGYLKDQKSKEIGNYCEIIFKLLLGEAIPFSIEEIEKRTNIQSKQIKNIINIINDNIKAREKIDRSIIKLSPLKNDKNIDNILNILEEYIVLDKVENEKIITIDNHVEKLNSFIDKIKHYYLEENHIKERIFLPKDENDVRLFFEDEIEIDKSIEIRNAFNKITEDNTFYFCNESINKQLFPTPIPRDLDFITNKELKLKLWREISRNISAEYENNMVASFIKYLENSSLFTLNDITELYNSTSFTLTDIKREISLNAILFCINGDVKNEDIEHIHNVLKSNKTTHLIFLLHSGQITEKASEKISNKELGREGRNILLEIHIHPVLIKKIICGYKASISTQKNDLNYLKFQEICNEIVDKELMIDKKIDDWLKIQKEKGLVIEQISSSTSNLKEFADALKFYIHYIEEPSTYQVIYENNVKKILKYRKYKSGSGLLSTDLVDAKNKFIELTTDLVSNGFLEKINEKYKIVESPIEKKIIEIITHEKQINIKDLEDYFIVREKKKKVMTDVYLNILLYKGKIKIENNFYILTNIDSFFNELKLSYDSFKSTTSKENFSKYANYYVQKKDEDNIIVIEDFTKLIDSLYSNIKLLKSVSNTEYILEKMSLCKLLLEQFNKDFKPAILEASSEGNNLVIAAGEKIDTLRLDLSNIITNINKWLKYDLNIDNFKQYKDINDQFMSLHTSYDRIFTREELEDIRSEVKNGLKFKFDIPNNDAYYFNLKYFYQKKKYDSLIRDADSLNSSIKRINTLFEGINGKEGSLKSKIATKVIPKENIIATNIFNQVKFTDILENIDTKEYKDDLINISKIENKIESIKIEIEQRINSKSIIIQQLDEFSKSEQNFLINYNHRKELLEKIKLIFDIEKYSEYYTLKNSKLNEIKLDYESSVNSISIKNGDLKINNKNIKDLFKSWEKDLQYIDFNSEWQKYSNDIQSYIKRIKGILELIANEKEIMDLGINEKIKILESIIVLPLNQMENKLSDLESKKLEIKKLSMELAHKYISDDEAKILNVLYQKKEDGILWISIDELTKEVINKYNLKEKAIKEALDNLITKKYMQQGLSISF